MRAPRAYLAGFGTSGSLLTGAALLFILASAFIGFHGWPQVGDSPATVAVSVPRAPVGTTTSAASRSLAGHHCVRGFLAGDGAARWRSGWARRNRPIRRWPCARRPDHPWRRHDATWSATSTDRARRSYGASAQPLPGLGMHVDATRSDPHTGERAGQPTRRGPSTRCSARSSALSPSTSRATCLDPERGPAAPDRSSTTWAARPEARRQPRAPPFTTCSPEGVNGLTPSRLRGGLRRIRRLTTSSSAIWERGLSSEIGFWEEYFRTEGRQYPRGLSPAARP